MGTGFCFEGNLGVGGIGVDSHRWHCVLLWVMSYTSGLGVPGGVHSGWWWFCLRGGGWWLVGFFTLTGEGFAHTGHVWVTVGCIGFIYIG